MMVTCRVLVPSDAGSRFWVLGRLLAERPFCHVPVRLGHGVELFRGSFSKSGRLARPALEAEGAVLEVLDVPADIALREAAESNGTIDVVGVTDVAAAEALMESVRCYGNAIGYIPSEMSVTFTGLATLSVRPGVVVSVYPGSFHLSAYGEVSRSDIPRVAKSLLRDSFCRALDELELP